MKLLAPNVGWVLQQNHLYWTQDNGQDWADITPGGPQQQVGSVFFLDKTRGWALVFGTDAAGEIPSIQIASTQNSGQSWHINTIGTDVFQHATNIAGVTSILFADTQHGWLVLRMA
jgi:photosystem II stability/assembly factor-like uncharacterized protein